VPVIGNSPHVLIALVIAQLGGSLGFSLPGQIRGKLAKPRHTLKALALRLIIVKIGGGKWHPGKVWLHFPEPDQAVRLRKFERTEQDRVHNAEDCRVCADPERQRNDRDCRNAAIPDEHAKPELHVLPERIHGASPGMALVIQTGKPLSGS
jgi:hypothetical protein